MANIEIKTEYLPMWCEICHQSDLFDPTTNICTRCADVKASMVKPAFKITKIMGRSYWRVLTWLTTSAILIISLAAIIINSRTSADPEDLNLIFAFYAILISVGATAAIIFEMPKKIIQISLFVIAISLLLSCLICSGIPVGVVSLITLIVAFSHDASQKKRALANRIVTRNEYKEPPRE